MVLAPALTEVVVAIRDGQCARRLSVSGHHQDWRNFFTVFGAITLMVVGLYLIWRSRQSDLSSAMTTAGWAVLIMVTVTAILMPEGHDGDAFRNRALEAFNISYGASFGPFAGKMFRIGHLGDVNELMMMGALAGTEMALTLAGVPHKKGGVQAAMDYLVSAASPARAAAE